MGVTGRAEVIWAAAVTARWMAWAAAMMTLRKALTMVAVAAETGEALACAAPVVIMSSQQPAPGEGARVDKSEYLSIVNKHCVRQRVPYTSAGCGLWPSCMQGWWRRRRI